MRTKGIYSLISAVAFAGSLCFVAPAFAVPCDGTNASPGPCDEVEPNDSTATATLLGTLLTTLSVDGAILDDSITNPFPPGDADFFSFVLLTSSEVQLTTTVLTGETIGDTILTLLDSVGATLASNDDGGPDLVLGYSQILFSDPKPVSTVLGPGTYFAVVEGKVTEVLDPDTGEGTGVFLHDEPAYNLLIERAAVDGAVPEPASLVLLGSGLVGLALWRRKRA